MIAFSGVRSSWDMFARNCDLCWLASASWPFASWSCLEEPGVLDGDDGLVRERLQQRDLLLGERPDLHPPQHDRADRDTIAEQGRGEDRTVARNSSTRLRGCVLSFREFGHVVDVDRPALGHRAPGDRSSDREPRLVPPAH